MTRKTMRRRIGQTEIKVIGAEFVVDELISEPLESIIVMGTITKKNAEKIAKEQYGHLFSQVIVIGEEYTEKLYELELNVFLQHAYEIAN